MNARGLIALAAAGLFLFAAPPARACTVTAENVSMGAVSSLDAAIQETGVSGASGFACTGLLNIAGTSYVKVEMVSSMLQLTGGPDNQTIPFLVRPAPGAPPLGFGQEIDFTTTSLLTLLSGPGASLPLYFETVPTPSLRAGTYTGAVDLLWYYSVCTGIGLPGVCLLGYSNSPGASSTLLGGLGSWGTGAPVTLTITLIVENDCAIAAPDLDFGVAPLAAAFSAATRTITIRCSAGQAYDVGMSDGAHFGAGSRRMRSAAGDYLHYEIFQSPGSPVHWGSVGAERRGSDTAETNPGVYDGIATQGFTYRAIIDPAQPTPPAGIYSDSIVLDVEF